MIPPKPEPRKGRVGVFGLLRGFRKDVLSALPAHLYHAWMARFRTPFFRSYLCNDPALIALVLKQRPDDFPKSNRIREGLAPLLGQSVFVSNGDLWKKQRRIIDPAFEGGRLRDAFPAMLWAAQNAVARMPQGRTEIEAHASHAAADVIFRTLFSVPIDDHIAAQVFTAFQTYQRSQPLLNLGALLALPPWFPRFHRRKTRQSAAHLRGLMTEMTMRHAARIAAGNAPDDLAYKIMTMADPQTGARFTTAEMVDQVAIFFLAGHETSASALAWALYLLAVHPEVQARVAEEVQAIGPITDFSALSKLRLTRDCFRETLRLYPPVPMMVRENIQPEVLRGVPVAPGGQIVISPWHVHRHALLWDNPDGFNPDRWVKAPAHGTYIPFSAGPRVCTGAGFAMMEGTLLLAHLVRAYHFSAVGVPPKPIAHLTVRAADGIYLNVRAR